MNRKAKKTVAIVIIVIIAIIAVTSINSYVEMVEGLEQFDNVSIDCEIWFIGNVSVENGIICLRGIQVATLIMACIATILISD